MPAGTGGFVGQMRRMGQENIVFEKRTGEVVENTGLGPENEPERT